MRRWVVAILACGPSAVLAGALGVGCGDAGDPSSAGGDAGDAAADPAADATTDGRDGGGEAAAGDAGTDAGTADGGGDGDGGAGDGGAGDGGGETGTDAGDDGATGVGTDGGVDGSLDGDAGGDAAGDAADAPGDASVDAAGDAPGDGSGDVPCVIVGTACSPPAGGVCKGGGCATCIDTIDDAMCASAYGAGRICYGSACVVGNCHTDANCAGPATPACANGTCTACDAPSGNVYLVDPVKGSDTVGTGGATSAVCAFKTVSKAIAVINGLAGGPPVGTQIQVRGPNNAAATETFPWAVPANTALRSTGGAVIVGVHAAVDAVQLSKPSSSINGFVLNGFGQGVHGIVVNGTATVGTVSIANVSVASFVDAGIRAEGTSPNVGATLGDNVSVSASGTLGNPRSGLLVTDSAQVVIDVTSGSAVGTAFHSNTGSGIEVSLQGRLAISGAPYQTLCGGTVTAKGNAGSGLTFRTSPGNGGAPAASSVDGLVACDNTRGLWVEATAQLKVRRSVFYRNQTGIHVAASSAGGLANPDDLSGLDLGASAAGDPGKNLIQAPAALGQNSSVGLCLNIHPSKGETLRAYGNTFMATLAANTAQYDCSKPASAGAQLTMVVGTTCSGGGGVSYSGWGVTGNTLGVDVCVP